MSRSSPPGQEVVLRAVERCKSDWDNLLSVVNQVCIQSYKHSRIQNREKDRWQVDLLLNMSIYTMPQKLCKIVFANTSSNVYQL